MKNRLHVWPQSPIVADGHVELAAVLEHPAFGSQRLWYRVPEQFSPHLGASAEAFTVASISHATRLGAALHVHGQVSPTLLRNLEEFATVWHCWRPAEWSEVELTADQEQEPAPAADDHAIACFSGGADACATVFRHTRGDIGRQRRNLRAGLMIQGFDIPVGDDAAFTEARRNGKCILDSVGVETMWVATNWRAIEQCAGLKWNDVFAVAALSCLSLFGASFRYGLLASPDRSYAVRPAGSTPLTDPMLGRDGFRIVHDGGALSRTAKLGLIAHWPEAMQHLRVCWEGPDRGGNCGACEKCVRTILNLRTVGVSCPPCFPREPGEAEILRIPIRTPGQLYELQSILDEVRRRGLERERWALALARRVARAERTSTPVRRMARKLGLRRHLNRLQSVWGGG
ncbi:MAG: hypothetical protein WD534_03740 [Phycisphaeraceae bacterium]